MEDKKPRHIVVALNKLYAERTFDENAEKFRFIGIENATDIKGVAPTICFTMQSDPIAEVGVNGVQATDLLHYVKCLFESLDKSFPCRENAMTITKIEEALFWQEARTKNRIVRKVEGKNEL